MEEVYVKVKKEIFEEPSSGASGVRINKYLADAGICSRRAADEAIAAGLVTIDGEKALTGSRVLPGQAVTYKGRDISKIEELVLLAFNKPVGIVCTTDRRDPDNIIDYISYDKRIFPIGRLDKDSEGLILLTNDGNIVNKILRAGNFHEKEYVVTVNREITPEFITSMGSGVPILDTVTRPCTVEQLDRFTFRIILTQGLNRQIRRMCEYLGYRVRALTRVRIMNINLGRLKVGTYRNVTEAELVGLKNLIAGSSNAPVQADEPVRPAPVRSASIAGSAERPRRNTAGTDRAKAPAGANFRKTTSERNSHDTGRKNTANNRTDKVPRGGRKGIRAGRQGNNK